MVGYGCGRLWSLITRRRLSRAAVRSSSSPRMRRCARSASAVRASRSVSSWRVSDSRSATRVMSSARSGPSIEPSPPRTHTPGRHDERGMGTSNWPPARTSTWPPAGTFPWPRTVLETTHPPPRTSSPLPSREVRSRRSAAHNGTPRHAAPRPISVHQRDHARSAGNPRVQNGHKPRHPTPPIVPAGHRSSRP